MATVLICSWPPSSLSPATIRIENADGTDGLQVAYYENYILDSLSISIYPSWLTITPAGGHIMPGGSETPTVSFRAGNMAPGIYTGNVFIESNDPSATSVSIPVSMEVQLTGVDNPIINPFEFSLSQNYPNPFNAQTTISYSLAKAAVVTIDIFEILGRKIESLADEMKLAGEYQTIWDASGRSSGIYFYRIKMGDKVEAKKMVLMK